MPAADAAPAPGVGVADARSTARRRSPGITVRVCAELGRARMPSAEIVGLPSGAVVELDRQADEPIDLYVNGRRFATGRLVVVDGADWAVRIESILGQPENNMKKEVAWMARVLVVDDAAFMRKMVTDALTKGGHEVVGEAGNGVEAIDRFQELKPDLTTLDITMPEKDGITALKEIIELDPAARVIMCSALGQESKVLESIKLGAKDFVVKPFQADRVLDAVGKALA